MSGLHFLKLDMAHADYDVAIETLRAEFAVARPGNELSIIQNKDATQAWVKCCSDTTVDGPVVLDTAPMAQINRVRVELRSEAWLQSERRPGKGGPL